MTTSDPQPRPIAPTTPEGAAPPDSYGAPDLGDFSASTTSQPFPEAEPTAEAPSGTYELDPSVPYEPYQATSAPSSAPASSPAPAATPEPPPFS